MSTLRMGVTSRVNSLYQDTLNFDKKVAKKSLVNLSVILESYELPELAKIFKAINCFDKYVIRLGREHYGFIIK